jgi:hypothetical protein
MRVADDVELLGGSRGTPRCSRSRARHIVRLYDDGEDGEMPFLVMEYVFRQSPKPGTRAVLGSTVTLTVSTWVASGPDRSLR